MERDIEIAARIQREKIHKELQDGYSVHGDINLYTAFSGTVEKYAVPLFKAGAEWRINSAWHDVTEEPELNEFFVYCDENDQYETDCFYKEFILTVNWEDYVAVNNLKRWAYMKDLIPKKMNQL